MIVVSFFVFFFFFQAEDGIRDVAVTGVQTCALPICRLIASFHPAARPMRASSCATRSCWRPRLSLRWKRSEEHTSELQSRLHLVCRLLLEKKKTHISPAATAAPTTLSPPRRSIFSYA